MCGNKLKLIIFDFDGVLCSNKLFYCDKSEKMLGLLPKIESLVFGNDHIIIDHWMRGEYSYKDVISIIGKTLCYPEKDLELFLFESIELFRIREGFKNLLGTLSNNGYRLLLVTNNVDVFDKIAVVCDLEKYFRVIIKSADVGCLKHEKDGQLYDFALSKFENLDFRDCLLIDDSEKACATFKGKGGNIIRYTDFDKMMEKLRILL